MMPHTRPAVPRPLAGWAAPYGAGAAYGAPAGGAG